MTGCRLEKCRLAKSKRQPEGSKYSRGKAVVSKQAAEALAATNSSASRSGCWGGEEQGVSFALMTSLGVKMRDKFGQCPMQRAFPEQDEPRKTLVLDGARPPFGEGVQVRAARRYFQTPDTLGPQYIIEGRTGFGIPIV